MNQLTISSKIETCFSIKKLVNLIEAQILELDENLELTSEEIFEIVCQESHLNTDFRKDSGLIFRKQRRTRLIIKRTSQ